MKTNKACLVTLLAESYFEISAIIFCMVATFAFTRAATRILVEFIASY